MKNVIGQKFGMLTVVSDAKIPASARREAGQRIKNRYVRCRCECGKSTAVRVDHLRAGRTRSCGCLSAEMQFNKKVVAVWDGLLPGITQDAQRDYDAKIVASQVMMEQAQATARTSPVLHPEGTKTERAWEMAPGQYQVMLTAQGGVCAICDEPPVLKPLVVDHDHATGEIRGLLCTQCNWGLGHFKDSGPRLMAAMVYLSGRK